MALLTQAQVFALFKAVESFDDAKPFATYTAAESYFSDRLGFAVPRSSLAAACKTTGKKVVRRMAQKAKGNSDLVKAIADVHGRVDHLGQRLDNLQIAFTNATASYRNVVQKEVGDRLTALEESARTISGHQGLGALKDRINTIDEACVLRDKIINTALRRVEEKIPYLEQRVDEHVKTTGEFFKNGNAWADMINERLDKFEAQCHSHDECIKSHNRTLGLIQDQLKDFREKTAKDHLTLEARHQGRMNKLDNDLHNVAEAVASNSKLLKLTVERQTSFDISLNAIRDKVQRLEAMPHNQWRPVSNEELTT